MVGTTVSLAATTNALLQTTLEIRLRRALFYMNPIKKRTTCGVEQNLDGHLLHYHRLVQSPVHSGPEADMRP
jgi:hypothetical protein